MLVILQGRLGNQMFEYAFAKALQNTFKTDVKLCAVPYEGDNNLSDIALTTLNINLDILHTQKELKDFYYKNDKYYVIFPRLRAKSKIARFIIGKILPRRFRHESYKYIINDSNNLVDIIKNMRDNGGGGGKSLSQIQ